MSIWDSPEFAPSGDFVKFDAVGDKVSGVITNIGRKTWPDGSVSPQLDLTDDAGNPRTLTAGQTRLKLALAEHRPEVGDHISVEMTRVEKRDGGKTLKHFDVVVKRAAGATAATGAAPAGDDEPPF